MLQDRSGAVHARAAAKLVTPGNIEDDLGNLADCDWIVEAVLERLDVKQALYRKLEAVRRPGSAVSLQHLHHPAARSDRGHAGDAFRRDFLITHFFNPPRYMRLLEIVAGRRPHPTRSRRWRAFADLALGKTVVRCKDRPGFIANRLGIFWMQTGVIEAIDAGLTVEEADAVMGKPFGIPKTGVFGLLDLVGLDLMPHVNAHRCARAAQEPMRSTPSIATCR